MASSVTRIDTLENQLHTLEGRLQLLEQEVGLAEVTATSKQIAVLHDRLEQLSTAAVRIAAYEVRIAELKRCKQEADKRQWQFVYIFAGGMATLLSSVVVQLLLWALKK